MSGGPDEARLARAAAAGDGQAFARLYDAYEQRIYTFCVRLVGNEQDAQDATQEAFLKVLQRLPKLQDRELNFGAYLFTAARNASYDVIGRRKKAEAVDEIPEAGARPVYGDGAPLEADPERAAMLGSLQESVRAANGVLPERQREVLALRELEELSYDEIAEIMDMNRNSVAQLISRARIRLRDELRGSALASVAASSADCERALVLISMRQDGQLREEADGAWLAAHLADCETCKVSVEAMEEAGISYRAWTPVIPAAFLFRDTMARAAELTGSDWSRIGRPGPGAALREGDADDSRRRGLLAGLLAAFLLLLGGGVALVVGSDDPPRVAAETTPTTQPGPAVVTTAPTPGTRPATTTARGGGDDRDRGRTSTSTTRTVTTPAGTTTLQTVTAPTPTTTAPTKQRTTKQDARPDGGRGGGIQGTGRPPLTGTPAPTTTPPTTEPPSTTTEPPVTTTEPTSTTAPPTTTTPPPDCTSPTQANCTPTAEYCRRYPNDPRCSSPPRAALRSTTPTLVVR